MAFEYGDGFEEAETEGDEAECGQEFLGCYAVGEEDCEA